MVYHTVLLSALHIYFKRFLGIKQKVILAVESFTAVMRALKVWMNKLV